ncbi:unnamed protein product [Rotaria magnacalcarata]|nr:unnamed protein product [Rotaria magnacalcarata]
MLDDDLYGVPRLYAAQGVTCECPYVNHACEPNCHYGTGGEQFSIIAFRDIKPEEELTVHYGCHDTEASLWSGIDCKCGGPKCVGVLKFNFWRDEEFQRKYAHCLSAYINRKIKDLYTSSDSSNVDLNVSNNHK